MGGPSNHSQQQGFVDWMRGIERRVLTQERRSTRFEVQRTLGPGFGKYAQQVFDWNEEQTWLAGQFWSNVGAFNTPNGTLAWVGSVRSASGVGGVQEVTSMTTLARYHRGFTFNVTGIPTFTSWVAL